MRTLRDELPGIVLACISGLCFALFIWLIGELPLVGAETQAELAETQQAREFEPETAPLSPPVKLEETKIPLTAEPEEPEDPEPEPAPEPQPKYSVTAEERELMAQIVYLEANTESAEGQQAVAEVILNRRDNARFPDTIREVIFAPGQFTSAGYLEWAKTNADNYAAVDAALMGDAPILEPDVVFFSQQGENDRVYAKIGNHVFCREYIW